MRAAYCRRSAQWGAIGLIVGGTIGCTRAAERSRFEGPDEQLEILETWPPTGARKIPPDARIDLCISNWVDPRSLDEIDATISSGNSLVDAELSVQLVPWLAPGGAHVPADPTGPWCEGSVLSIQPITPMRAGALHRVQLQPTAVGWGGETMATDGPLWLDSETTTPRYTLEFTIDAVEPVDPLPPIDPVRPVVLRDLFAPGEPFDPARPLCSCHRDPSSPALAVLDLRDPAVAFEALLGNSRPRETGFPMVSPREPSLSFLVHKLLRQSDGTALLGVFGAPMPKDAELPYADLLAIIEWIADGAEP